MTLQIGADKNGIFAASIFGIGVNAHHAEHLPGRLFEGNERHGAGIVDLRKSRDETVAEFLDRCEKAQPQVVLSHGSQEGRTQNFVLGSDRAHEKFAAVGQRQMPDVETIEAQGYTVIGGDVYGGDGFEKSPAKIVSNVLTHVRPGSIVILHMHGGPNAPETANALPNVISKLRLRGYTFVKVSDLLSMSRSKD